MAVITEADVFSRVIDATNPTLTPEAATGILQLGYSEADHARMAALAEKSNNGILTQDERRELESYVFVGDVLSLLKSKARLSLLRNRSIEWRGGHAFFIRDATIGRHTSDGVVQFSSVSRRKDGRPRRSFKFNAHERVELRRALLSEGVVFD